MAPYAVLESGPNNALTAISSGPSVVDLGPEFSEHYGYNGPTKAWVNSNLSPHFPYAGQIWTALWKNQSGMTVDGVLAIDPTGLSYLLAAAGPVTLDDGTKVSAKNVVDLTLRDAYARFDKDERSRDGFLTKVLTAAADAVLDQKASGPALLKGLSRAASERRLLLWSPDAETEQALGQRPLAGRLPDRSGRG